MQNRQMADREIYGALQKYQLIIQEQVEKQRSEIKTSKKPLVPPRAQDWATMSCFLTTKQ